MKTGLDPVVAIDVPTLVHDGVESVETAGAQLAVNNANSTPSEMNRRVIGGSDLGMIQSVGKSSDDRSWQTRVIV